ncbi:MAG: hypothetical protein AAF449_02500 [Myxococcota bacterium]
MDTVPAPEVLSAALQRAEAQAPPSYYMEVSCVDDKGARSLQLLRSGTGVWNRSTQIVLPASARKKILALLRETNYATMAPSYGGKKNMPAKNALHVRCEVSVDFGEVQKTSVQLADGDQSPRVAGLASRILDYTESLGLEGRSATSLREAIESWVTGELRPDTLNLRILQLPPTQELEGLLVEVRRGNVVKKRYTPGRSLGPSMPEPFDREALTTLLKAMLDAEFQELPANLMCDETVEVEVVMLGHRKKIVGRKFGRALPPEMSKAQNRFDRLLVALRYYAG